MPAMAPELEKPRVTEIQVRMDCNGCVQKVKKALNGITGIYDVQINYPEQKLTILGWADPEKIVKAIRKTRKTATICTQTAEQAAPAAAPDEGAPPAEPEEGSAEAAPPTEPPQDQQPQPQAAPEPGSDPPVINLGQPPHQLEPGEAQEVRVVYGQPPDQYRNAYSPSYGSLNTYQNIGRVRNDPPSTPQPQIYATQLPPPNQTTQGYNTSRLSRPVFETEPPLQVRATHNYNTSRPQSRTFTAQPPPPQMSAIQPPSNFQEHQNHRRHRSPPPPMYATLAPQTPAFQPERAPQFQEIQNYRLSRLPLPPIYATQPPQMPAFQPDPPPQIREPQQYDQYRPSPRLYANQAPQLHHTYQPAQPVISTQNYNTYSPSSYVTDHIQLPSASTPYNAMDRYNEDYRYASSSYNSNANIASMFSDENPNACTIM